MAWNWELESKQDEGEIHVGGHLAKEVRAHMGIIQTEVTV